MRGRSVGKTKNLDPDGAIAKVIKEAEEVWKPFITPEVRYVCPTNMNLKIYWADF